VFQAQINLKKLNRFISVFLILFIFSPFVYAYISITETDKRTDYAGKEIAKKVQKEWDDNFIDEITVVTGDEWLAGNLSYHLKSRPVWNGSNGGLGSIIVLDKSIPCENEKIEAFDGSGRVHCFNMDPQVIMIGRTK
ncbi:hypothetical protein N8698_03605, partial [Candidatus Pelagibacter sp.]|nr:hypothetical protein [Candidatus Pelagibacter sp.]